MSQDGKRQCPECGEIGREIPPVKVSRMNMGAVGRAAGVTDRVATYRHLAAVASERGYKPGWVAYRYKALYDAWPTRDIIAKASAIVGAQPWGLLPAKPPPGPLAPE